MFAIGSATGKVGRLGHRLGAAILAEEPYRTSRRGSHPMRRREMLLLLATCIMGSRAVRAQQKAMPVVGALTIFSPPARSPFLQGLSEAGFVEGQNVAIERRSAESHYDRFPALAADLVARKDDVIAALGGIWAALAARDATSTIPIVFAVGTDAVE